MIDAGRRLFTRSSAAGSVPASTTAQERTWRWRAADVVAGHGTAGASLAERPGRAEKCDVGAAVRLDLEPAESKRPDQHIPVVFDDRRHSGERRIPATDPAERSSADLAATDLRRRQSASLAVWIAGGILAGGLAALVWHRRRLPGLASLLRHPLGPRPSSRSLVRAMAGPAPGFGLARLGTGLLSDAVSGIRRPPRVVSFITVKRIRPRLGDTYGHWWVEVGGDESYGWWPRRCPLRIPDAVFGVHGRLNAVGTGCRGGTMTRDPHHGEHADFAFHPTLLVRKSDRRLRTDIRAFAGAYAGEWRWSPRRSGNCRSFQLELFDAVGLTDGPAHYQTRGHGCPFMRVVRMAKAWLISLCTGHQPPYALIPPPLRPAPTR